MGTMDYSHRHEEFNTIVSGGQWASEPVLWVMWKHCGIFAAQTSCELVQLHAGKFRTVSCRESLSHSYVSSFAKGFRNKLMSNPTWYTDIWFNSRYTLKY